MIKVKDLDQETFRRLARFVKIARDDGKSDPRILTMFQISADDLAFIDQYNAASQERAA